VSSTKPPPAEGVRVHWEQLPHSVRIAIEERIGGTVAEAATQPGGFSPGLAARVRTTDGRRCFVKAVSEQANPDTPRMHRREAEVVAALPSEAPVPRLLWTYDENGWVALGFEDVEGHTPNQPWRDDDLRLVVEGLHRLHEVLTPSPIDSESASNALATLLKGWDELKATHADDLDDWSIRNLDRLVELEARAPAAVEGDTLLNFDVRADNLLIAKDKVFFVDWPWARVGAPFVEWVALAPSVQMQGGPKAGELLETAGLPGIDEAAIDAVIASITGYFLAHSRRPPPPGIPTVRAFQAAHLASRANRVGLDSRQMHPDEQLEELVISVMRGKRPMTASEIARAVLLHAEVRIDERSVVAILHSHPKRFARKRRGRFFQRSTRWQLVEAGPADEPGTAGARVPARPYPPTLSGAAAADLTFREDDPPASAMGRTA